MCVVDTHSSGDKVLSTLLPKCWDLFCSNILLESDGHGMVCHTDVSLCPASNPLGAKVYGRMLL